MPKPKLQDQKQTQKPFISISRSGKKQNKTETFFFSSSEKEFFEKIKRCEEEIQMQKLLSTFH